MTNKQAAKETGMSNDDASKAFCIYKKEGLPALKLHAEHITKISASRIPKFTEEQAQEVQQAFDREQRLKDKALLEVLVLRAQGATLEKIKNKTGLGMAIIRKEIKTYLKYGLPKSPHGGVTY